MQFYKEWLEKKNYDVVYIEADEPHADIRRLIAWLAGKKFTVLHYANVTDDWLGRRLQQAAAKQKIELKVFDTPAFLNSAAAMKEYFDARQKYFQTDFYIAQRKQRNILLDANKQPEGGHWSFDADNRKKFPKHETIPEYNFPKENKYVNESRRYVEKHFGKNYGSNAAPFKKGMFSEGEFPSTFDEAESWLEDFIKHRFEKFGVYEDAIVKDENILYHSVLSPLLNVGLLTPQQVLDGVLKKAVIYKVPLNSLEGFVRQLIGWREYICLVYERESRKQRTTNYWGFTRKIPAIFWKGETGIVPVDVVIKRVLQSGYSHHIERLMIMGNFMLLCEFDPNEVYKWFMELFVDAYDWVMVPNTYGMTQFADGGLMMTKPYISGSNYILKMSDFTKGEWQQTWDSLFWRFMHVHRDFFEQNPRLGLLLKTFDKMPSAKKKDYINTAEKYLKQLDKENKSLYIQDFS